MALVNTGFQLTVTLVDSGNNRSTLRYDMDSANVPDYATALAAATGMLADIGGVSGAVVANYSVNTVFREDGLVLPADEEVEDKASISFSMDNGKTGNLRVPAPLIDIFQGATTELRNQVDIADLAVVAYTDNFRTAGEFLVSETNKLVQLVRGKRIHVKNSNG